ncbi:MAG: hypothetical protein A2512_12700 [Deltaproteobacteria bacterium RIFOXYD12_FULL_56_24]|nr:MAG: hypothetical protein A2512_12700 [Deltaproteobacteria bacterium RIFOXYD12_FULL_56_24]
MPALSILKNRNNLVTGGAGYIGSQTIRQLVNAGCNVVVVDNFYSSNRGAVPVSGVQFRTIETDRQAGDPPTPISDPQRIKELFAWRLSMVMQ